MGKLIVIEGLDGSGDTIIMESCEYCDSFLNFYPTVAIINNIEADHLDYFKDLAAVQRSFRKFAGLVPRTGARARASSAMWAVASSQALARPTM